MENVSEAYILLASDDTLFSSACAEALTAEGHLVRQASDAEQALLEASLRPPALVFLDLQLPGTDELETLRRLKSASVAAVPVFMLTDEERADDAARCLEAGAEDVLWKAKLLPSDALRIAKRCARMT